jgi:hypothetical protein
MGEKRQREPLSAFSLELSFWDFSLLFTVHHLVISISCLFLFAAVSSDLD